MKPGFLVDGVTEQKFVQLACKGRPVQRINCNGVSVSVEAIAKRVASLIRLWRGRCYPVVVLVDLEARSVAASEFCEALVQSIRSEGINDQLVVGVADTMIENWMLGDPDLWPGLPDPGNVDGCHGASMVKQRLGNYDKVANGPGLLLRCRASEIAKRSASFRSFFNQLALARCAWLSR